MRVYIPNTKVIRAQYIPLHTCMYWYIPGMYQYIPPIHTKIHAIIHTNTSWWYLYVLARIVLQYVHYTSLMLTSSVSKQRNASFRWNRISSNMIISDGRTRLLLQSKKWAAAPPQLCSSWPPEESQWLCSNIMNGVHDSSSINCSLILKFFQVLMRKDFIPCSS